MEPNTATEYWDFFDKIYCISLEERADRRKEVKIQFDRVGLSFKVEFYIAPKHPDDCEEGIYNSHVACIKKGIQAGASRMVIFEDDVRFERFDPANLKNCIDFLSSHPCWNALFFGCLVSGSKKIHSRSVVKVKYRSLAHAYVLNRRFAEILAATPWQETAFDALLKELQEEFYAIYPSFAFQSNSPTSNERYWLLDRFRRLCGGLHRIQKWNEFYSRHKIPIIALHLMLLTFLFWILLLK